MPIAIARDETRLSVGMDRWRCFATHDGRAFAQPNDSVPA